MKTVNDDKSALLRWFKQGSLCLLCVGGLAVAAQSSAANEKHQVATLITTSAPMPQRQLLGNVSAPQSQVLSSQVEGLVVSQRMEMGQRVSAGDVLVKLDNREAAATVKLKQAELKIAANQLEQQQLEFVRAKKTRAQKAISQAEFDDIKLALLQAEGQLDVVKSDLEIARIILEKYTIRAPFDGALVIPTPVVGLYANVGEKLTELLNDSELRADVQLSPQEIGRLRRNELWLNLNQTALKQALTLRAMSPAADNSTGMVAASFYLPTETVAAKALQPGQVISLTLYSHRLNIPPKSIHRDEQGEFLFTVEQGKVRRVAIDNIEQGQQIIVLGFNGMKIGDSVSTVSVDGKL